jgi:hypothetical protein
VIAPEVPGGKAVGHAVFVDHTDSQGDDALSVVAAWGRQVGQIDAERPLAGGAIMTGVRHLEDTGSVTGQTADVVQGPLAEAVAVAGVPATRTAPAAIVARPLANQGLGQVFDTGDAFGAVRDVLSRSRSHDRLLQWLPAPNIEEPLASTASRRTRFLCYSLENAEYSGPFLMAGEGL